MIYLKLLLCILSLFVAVSLVGLQYLLGPLSKRVDFVEYLDEDLPIKNAILVGNMLVPIAAYFDGRPQYYRRNATVVFADVLEQFQRRIVGCEVDGRRQTDVLVRPVHLTGWIKDKHPVTHTEVIVLCFNMETTSTSEVSLLFKPYSLLMKVPVKWEGVVMPGTGKEKDQVMVCATGYGRPKMLDQWLVYQQTIGVEFIHLNVDVSFVHNVNKSDTLQRLIDSGYARMVVWEPYLSKKHVFLYSQSFKYQDCILRYQNTFKYMMIVDFDEFFVPLGSTKDIGNYARKLLRGKHTASVLLPSIRYYCRKRIPKNMSMPQDGNITTLYDLSRSIRDGKGKSVHLVKAIREATVHVAADVFSPYRSIAYQSVYHSECFISHLTTYTYFKRKCKHVAKT